VLDDIEAEKHKKLERKNTIERDLEGLDTANGKEEYKPRARASTPLPEAN